MYPDTPISHTINRDVRGTRCLRLRRMRAFSFQYGVCFKQKIPVWKMGTLTLRSSWSLKISIRKSCLCILSALKVFLIDLSMLLPVNSSVYSWGETRKQLPLAVLKKPQKETKRKYRNLPWAWLKLKRWSVDAGGVVLSKTVDTLTLKEGDGTRLKTLPLNGLNPLWLCQQSG